MEARKQREREQGAWDKICTSKSKPQVTYFLQLGPAF
jgi:hypothetical protein